MNSIVKGERNVLLIRRRGKANWIGHSWHRKFLLKKSWEVRENKG